MILSLMRAEVRSGAPVWQIPYEQSQYKEMKLRQSRVQVWLGVSASLISDSRINGRNVIIPFVQAQTRIFIPVS